MKRRDDFRERRKHLQDLSEEELENRFWELAEKLVEPLVNLAEKNTTPSIERSVLLRMGFSSLESKAIVDNAMDNGLMGKGVGNIVYRLSKINNISIREAGISLLEKDKWDEVLKTFKVSDDI